VSTPDAPRYAGSIDESSDDFALIDEAADELFGFPLSGVPDDWCSRLKMERNSLVITEVDLRLATAGMDGASSWWYEVRRYLCLLHQEVDRDQVAARVAHPPAVGDSDVATRVFVCTGSSGHSSR
jgi:hypothetical protein